MSICTPTTGSSRLANKLRQRQIRKLIFVIFPDISPKGETKLGGKKESGDPSPSKGRCCLAPAASVPAAAAERTLGQSHTQQQETLSRQGRHSRWTICFAWKRFKRPACRAIHIGGPPSLREALAVNPTPNARSKHKHSCIDVPPHSFQMHFKELCFVTIEWRDPKTQS